MPKLTPLEQQIRAYTSVERVGNWYTVWLMVGARRFDMRSECVTRAEAQKERTRLVKALAVLAETVRVPRAPRF